jgi:hypothetical protein
VERAGSILQENEELDVSVGVKWLCMLIADSCTQQTTETFDKFILAQARGDELGVEILRPLRLRYFSPEELLRLFCFDDLGGNSTFRWPEGVSAKTKYRLIGNSVNVFVVSRLIEYLCDAYDRSVGESRDVPAERKDERARFYFSFLRTTTIDLLSQLLAVSPTISYSSFITHSIFCVSRGFMLRPFSDSRQLLRFIHPNISYSVSISSLTRP